MTILTLMIFKCVFFLPNGWKIKPTVFPVQIPKHSFLEMPFKITAETIITSTKNLLRNLVAIKNKSQNTRINMTVQKSIERDDVCNF